MALGTCVVSIAQVRFLTIVSERQPGLNDYVQVEYTIENAKSVERLSPPAFKYFRLIQGPAQSNGMSYMNGRLSQFKSISFILQPRNTGKLIIPGASALIDGKMMRSEPVVVDVTHVGTHNNVLPNVSPKSSLWPEDEPRVEEEYTLRPGESIAQKIKQNLLVKADVNKTTCYEGEPLMATFKLCSRLRSESRVLKRPSLNGFSVYDMVEPEANNPTVESINGKLYNVHLIRKTQLFPLQAGIFEIDPVELNNKVTFIKTGPTTAGPRSPLQKLMDEYINDGIGGNIEEQSFSLASKPVTITVKPLPVAGKPEGFNGAVGKFSLHTEVTDRAVPQGEAIKLKLLIKGKGNFTVINSPSLQLPAGLEGYDPQITEKVDKSIYPLSGYKTFDYTIIARDTGRFTIPAIAFSYFDPADAQYKTEVSDSFRVHVTPVKKVRAFAKSGSPNRSGRSAYWIDYVPVNILVLSVAFFFFAGLGIYLWKRNRPENRNGASAPPARQAQAANVPTVAPEPLEEARQALKEGKSQLFYNEVNWAVWKKLSEKISISPTELNKYNAVTRLRQIGLGSECISQLESVLNECEIALYTPVHTLTDMQQTLTKAEQVMIGLDREGC